MKKLNYIFLFMLIFTQSVFISISKSNTSEDYMPLKIGNEWTYTVFTNMSYCCKIKIRVVSDTIINNKKYFKTSSPLPVSHVVGLSLRYYRVDSLSGNFYGYYNIGGGCSYSPEEVLIDSLSAMENDTNSICPSVNLRICTDIVQFPTLWGQSILRKRFQFSNWETQTPSAYFRGIGLAGSADGLLGEVSFDIIGCVVDNIVYGDTTLTSIYNYSDQIPDKYSLSQNYPNPFNPSTNLEFGISELGFVSLKIYDGLGREVQTLVNEQLAPGTYNYQFSTINYPLSSGVYFYRLEAGRFVETKRMMLLK